MYYKLAFVFTFTLIIHIIGTLSYSVRFVGIRTGRIAVSFALFNILVLVSRTANSFQMPLLAKVVETDMSATNPEHPQNIFHLLILSASVGTLIGAFLIPTFQILLGKLVQSFNVQRSIPKLMLHSFSKTGVKQIKDNFRTPSKHNIQHFTSLKRIPKRLILTNALVYSILTVGSFAGLYSAFITPDQRLTVSQLVPIITGLATIVLVVFIDPYLSLLTDDCLEGKVSESKFQQYVVLLVSSRFVGTLLAQVILLPAAWVICEVARWI